MAQKLREYYAISIRGQSFILNHNDALRRWKHKEKITEKWYMIKAQHKN